MELKKRVILASASPRRNILLQQIAMNFEIYPSNLEEIYDINKTPADNAILLSQYKAHDIAKRFTNAFIIGADTIVELDGNILGKPKDDDEAFLMLKKLSGRQHLVHTAFTIVDRPSNRSISEIETTIVKFRELQEEQIREYIDTQLPADKAGAYGIQDQYGSIFVETINGCFYNVVGFPLSKFYITMKNFQREIE